MPKTLLLADDSVVIQKLVGLSFANEDVELVTTDNGDDAITKARECRPDVVLADVVMPGRSGYEVCEAIKADPQLAHVPVILLTGTFEAFDEARARAAGSNGHITKPFEAQALVERVNGLLLAAEAAPKPAAPALEVFDGGAAAQGAAQPGRDAIGYDVTTAAEPPLAAPMAPPVPPALPDPLAAQHFDPGASASGLPPLTDSDPLIAPLDLTDVSEGPAPGRARAPEMLPEIAEDDLLATSGDPSATVTHMPFEATDATPPLEDAVAMPPPLPTRSDPLGDPGLADEPSDLQGLSDPSLTTIIMSEGDRSSDGISLGEPLTPVRSLDGESGSAGPADVSGAATMLDDELFSDPIPVEDSDSGFDFGTSDVGVTDERRGVDERRGMDERRGPDESRGPVRPEAPAADDSMLGHDPLATPFGIGARGTAPELASQYDVSSSELVDPFGDSARADAAGLPEVAEQPWLEPDPAEDEISLTDGLLGEPIGLETGRSLADLQPPPLPPTPAAVAAAASDEPATIAAPAASGPDITPVMRERIHDTLERVAWEALADLNETLVKQVIERVESIAWEVIPQMAEALIKEEIRRMKGDDE